MGDSALSRDSYLDIVNEREEITERDNYIMVEEPTRELDPIEYYRDLYEPLRETEYRGTDPARYVEDREPTAAEAPAYEAALAGGTPLELWLRSLRPTLMSITDPVGGAIGGVFEGIGGIFNLLSNPLVLMAIVAIVGIIVLKVIF